MAKTVTAVVAGVMVHVLRRLSQEYLVLLTSAESAWTIVWQHEELSQKTVTYPENEKRKKTIWQKAVLINEKEYLLLGPVRVWVKVPLGKSDDPSSIPESK